MADLVIGIILLIIIGGAVCYIAKAKKRGVKCIGCPAADSCSSRNAGSTVCECGCQSDASAKKR